MLKYSYFPIWFQIKLSSSITDGPPNFFDAMQRIKNFPELNITEISFKVLQRNAFFSHPKNILLAMLSGKDENVRKTTVDKIRYIRSILSEVGTELPKRSPRRFVVPSINVNSKVYHQMIDLSCKRTTEPPLTQTWQWPKLKNLQLHLCNCYFLAINSRLKDMLSL